MGACAAAAAKYTDDGRRTVEYYGLVESSQLLCYLLMYFSHCFNVSMTNILFRSSEMT